MNLGAFSISLNIKDLQASATFYAALGFVPVGGDAAQNWLIVRNGEHTIGLFQGMCDRNMLTFNPGWDQHSRDVANFTDVRELQRQIKSHGLSLVTEAGESANGPGSCMLIDPDGNPILIDQHR